MCDALGYPTLLSMDEFLGLRVLVDDEKCVCAAGSCVRIVQNARLSAHRRCEMVPDWISGMLAVELERFGRRQRGVEKIVLESTALDFRAGQRNKTRTRSRGVRK